MDLLPRSSRKSLRFFTQIWLALSLISRKDQLHFQLFPVHFERITSNLQPSRFESVKSLNFALQWEFNRIFFRISRCLTSLSQDAADIQSNSECGISCNTFSSIILSRCTPVWKTSHSSHNFSFVVSFNFNEDLISSWHMDKRATLSTNYSESEQQIIRSLATTLTLALLQSLQTGWEPLRDNNSQIMLLHAMTHHVEEHSGDSLKMFVLRSTRWAKRRFVFKSSSSETTKRVNFQNLHCRFSECDFDRKLNLIMQYFFQWSGWIVL
jgi:hypothetical protein